MTHAQSQLTDTFKTLVKMIYFGCTYMIVDQFYKYHPNYLKKNKAAWEMVKSNMKK